MSWLTAGTLRLAGTTDGGVLSGRVTVERVTLTQGLEVAGALVSSKEISGRVDRLIISAQPTI